MIIQLPFFIHILDFVGTAAFAAVGAMAAKEHNLGYFAAIILANTVAFGGGTTRDILLNIHPLFWMSDPLYLIVANSTAVAVIIWGKYLKNIYYLILLYFDAVGLAAFAIIGTTKGMNTHTNILVAAAMGMLTGVGGGALRDIFCNKIPVIFTKEEFYAVPAFIGGLVYFLLIKHHITDVATAAVLGLLSTFCLRGIKLILIQRIKVPTGKYLDT